MCVCARTCAHKSYNNLQGLVFSSQCVDPKDQTEVIHLGGKCFYLLSLAGALYGTTVRKLSLDPEERGAIGL